MTKYGDIVPFETAQIDGKLIVPFEMAQIPNVLFATGWTNHQIILNRCKSDTERLFYMLYAGKEHLENKELLRTIKTDTINSLLSGKDVQSEVMTKTYPTSPLLFKDKVYLGMIAIELKTTEFHPKDLGQLEFYLEALDQEERRSNENPSIGIILCKEADMEVVRYALNRSMSPTMVALYKEQLQVGSVIQRSLVEFCKFLKRK